MMKKFFPLCLLIISLPASALELTHILQGIAMPPSQMRIRQCEEVSDADLYHQCAVDLCGAPETSKTARVNDTNFDLFVNPEVKDRFLEIERPVQKIFEAKKKSLEGLVNELRKRQEGPDQGLNNFSDWDRWRFDGLATSVYSSLIKIEADKTKPISERVSVKILPPDKASESFLKGLRAFAEAKKERLLTSPSEGLWEDVYTEEEGLEYFMKLRDRFFTEYKIGSFKNPNLLEGNEDLIKKFQNIEALNLKQKSEIASAYNDLENLYNNLLYQSGKGDQVRLSRYCPDDCRQGIETYFKEYDFPAKLTKLLEAAKKFDLQMAQENCQADLISKAMRDSDKEKFLESFPSVKKNYLKRVFANFSDHSKKAFESYLDQDVHLSFINSDSAEVDRFVAQLKKDAENAEQESFGNAHSADLLQKLLSYREWGDLEEFDPELSCPSRMAFAAWDAFAPKEYMDSSFFTYDMARDKDNILVSLYTCSHGPQGRGVVSHEIGHALSYAVLKGKLSKESGEAYSKLRNCTTALYQAPLSGNSFLNREGDSLRTEEDMADVTGFLATQNEEELYSCALLITNKKSTRYEDLSFVNLLKADTHSAPFLRVVREAIYKKKNLSPSCKAVIEKNIEKFRFRPCI